MPDTATAREQQQSTSPDDQVGVIVDQIAALGFTPPRRFGRARRSICGTSVRLSVQDLLDNEPVAARFLAELCDIVSRQIPLCIVVEDFRPNVSTIDSWRRCCERIRDALQRRKLKGNALGFCMQSHKMPLEAYCLISDSLLGCGPRYVFLDSLQMLDHCDAKVSSCATANWTFLWRQRSAIRPVIPVYGGLVRSACRLLADEVASTVIPSATLHAPAGSAWVVIGLGLTRFLRPDRQIDWQRLNAAMRDMMKLADCLFDHADWADLPQRMDAVENRRLAVSVSGLGDLALLNNRPPTALDSLEWLTGIVRRIRAELAALSAGLANGGDVLPALARSNPVHGWETGEERNRWHTRWQQAVRESAVRHRHLLTMSPSSVLPTLSCRSAEYANLLPVIALADAWHFDCPAKLPGWTMQEFKNFHRHARATIQGSQRASFVADGV